MASLPENDSEKIHTSTATTENISPTTSNKTFFSSMPYKFSEISFTENEPIPTEAFLNSCSSIVPVFDLLGPTIFSPVKNDIQGNINKLTKKLKSNPTEFASLQKMILYEVEHKDEVKDVDATDALLWLKRALEFIALFLKELFAGDKDLSTCASVAYSQSLKEYHGWIIRGIFSLIVNAVPSRTTFIRALALDCDEINESIEKQIVLDGSKEMASLEQILIILKEFYSQHDLNSQKVV